MRILQTVLVYCMFVCRLMLSTRYTRTVTLFPYPTLFRYPVFGIAWSKGKGRAAGKQVARPPAIAGRSHPHRLVCDKARVARAGSFGGLHLQRGVRAFALQRQSRLENGAAARRGIAELRSEEHKSEIQSLMRISYAFFCLTKKIKYLMHH